MKVSVGNFSLERQPEPGRNGWYYWSLGHKHSKFFVWSDEISWVVAALMRLADHVDFTRFGQPGLYPLESQVGPDGGLVWFVHVGKSGKALALRRWSGSFRREAEEGEETIEQTRYFNYERAGKFPRQLWISERDVLSDAFRRFAAACAAAFCQMQAEAKVAVGGEVASNDVFRRVILTLDDSRRVPLSPGWPTDGASYEVVDRPLIGLVLEHCQSRTAGEIAADLQHRLDERAVRRLVPWTTRYAEDALRGGYFFFLAGEPGRPACYQASRDKTLFLSDPLLSSLVPPVRPAPPTKPPAELVPVPQYEKAPIDQARRQGWIAGDRPTRYGRAPIPTESRAAILRRFAALPASARRNRWRTLQLLDLYSAMLCNRLAAGERRRLADLVDRVHRQQFSGVEGKCWSIGYAGKTARTCSSTRSVPARWDYTTQCL